MSDYLRDRFPLADTSTVYMNGSAVYNLVHHDKPGIIAPVTMFPAQAEQFRAAIKEAMAEAFEEGADARWDVYVGNEDVLINPYRQEQTDG